MEINDEWFMERLIFGNKNAGYIVETRSGKGRTFHSDKTVNGKIPVYLENGGKILCSPENVKPIGFID